MSGRCCDQDHDHGILPPYNIDQALKELARARARRDPLTRAQVTIGEQLAAYLTEQFSPEELETAGRALLTGAASIGAIVAEQLPPAALVNILGFAGGRLVTDGREWEVAK